MNDKKIKLSDEIVFVTTNKGKIASANKSLKGINFTTYNYDLIEPRTDDIKEIAMCKVKQAYEIVKKPCIALDAGFFIDQLNGFPRAFVNFALDTIGVEGILKQMENIDNRKCSFKECLAYYDGENLLYFHGNHEGNLSTKMQGNDDNSKWSDLWYIFKPYDSNKTLNEMTEEERNSRVRNPKYTSAMEEFADYYYSTKNI